MPLFSLHQVSKYYGAQIVIQNISWGINPGHHVGLIGANGAGKTTILKLITSELTPDRGDISRQKGCRVGYLTQDPDLDPTCTVMEEAVRGLTALHSLEDELREAEQALAQVQGNDGESDRLLARYGRLQDSFERAGGYTYHHRTEAVLHGLGFLERDLTLPVHVLSGGQKTRLGLAKLLLGDSDLLLLDEPESHLDMQATEWLEKYLSEYSGAFLLVSHDRYFLDRTADRIAELEHHSLTDTTGNYTQYLKLKEERVQLQARQYQKQTALIARTEEFIRRNIAGQKTKQAQSRRKRLERLDRIERARDAHTPAGLTFSKAARGGDEVIIIEAAAKQYGDHKLFTDFSFKLLRGERVGIIGPNGSGKTSLLRMILGQEQPTSGSARIDPSITTGYYDQERAGLFRDRSVLNELWSVRPTMNEEKVRAILDRFLFSEDNILKQVGNLSGGEQGRLALAKLILDGPNLLILDEPTNHLDIPSRHALEQALQEYPETLLVVSHDRYFLDSIVNELLIFESDHIVRWVGSYSDYRAFREQEAMTAVEPSETKSMGNTRKPTPVSTKKREKKAGELELAIQNKEEEIILFEQDLSDEDVFRDRAKVIEIGNAYSRAKEELEMLYQEWETVTREIE
ncbi:MAG: ABC-F family ATP-binding cassette domain-containing protein [Gemmatimonadota bacterium]|nr:ABC-F family ATP-binding cassette domain-containing protein [Gemmatimonadota bacterium]